MKNIAFLLLIGFVLVKMDMIDLSNVFNSSSSTHTNIYHISSSVVTEGKRVQYYDRLSNNNYASIDDEFIESIYFE